MGCRGNLVTPFRSFIGRKIILYAEATQQGKNAEFIFPGDVPPSPPPLSHNCMQFTKESEFELSTTSSNLNHADYIYKNITSYI